MEDFLQPTTIDYKEIKRRRWTATTVLHQLQDFECWLLSGPDHVFWFDYVSHLQQKGEFVGISWFWDIRDRFEEAEKSIEIEVREQFKKIDLAIGRKKLKLAAQGKLREASVIFELKAKHGWRDGSEGKGNPQISVNMAIQGLSQADLERRITSLMAKGSMSERLDKIRAVEAEFDEIK